MRIRQQAFIDPDKKMLKGGLHIHTTRSDGHNYPEETIQEYYEQGYDFLSLTDHRIYNYKNFRPDLPITVIPGMENDCAFRWLPYHTVCLGPVKEEGNGYEQDEKFDCLEIHDDEMCHAWLKEIHDRKNQTIYCHPEWSHTQAVIFENHTEHFAMEIWNSGSAISCNIDKDAPYWDEILGQGKVIYGVAADDAHQKYKMGKGWVMVNAENDVNSILEALKNGAFYSSCGPEIYDFYIDGSTAVIECSPVTKIGLYCDMHLLQLKRSASGELVRAEFQIPGYDYVRVTVTDSEGNKAWTNPIFLDGRK